jgi:hypothetical protein
MGLAADEAFKTVYINGEASHLICLDCGAIVQRGIINVSGHWTSCSGKGFFDALLATRLEKGELKMSDVLEIKQKQKDGKEF